jgi:Flp pilus assembly pilin Flp
MDQLRTTAVCAAAWAARLAVPSPPVDPDPDIGTRDDERGQGLAEYALILGLIAVIAIAALTLFGANIADLVFDTIGGAIQGVIDTVIP